MEDARKNRTKWEDAIQELVLGFQYEQGQLGGTVCQQKKQRLQLQVWVPSVQKQTLKPKPCVQRKSQTGKEELPERWARTPAEQFIGIYPDSIINQHPWVKICQSFKVYDRHIGLVFSVGIFLNLEAKNKSSKWEGFTGAPLGWGVVTAQQV